MSLISHYAFIYKNTVPALLGGGGVTSTLILLLLLKLPIKKLACVTMNCHFLDAGVTSSIHKCVCVYAHVWLLLASHSWLSPYLQDGHYTNPFVILYECQCTMLKKLYKKNVSNISAAPALNFFFKASGRLVPENQDMKYWKWWILLQSSA